MNHFEPVRRAVEMALGRTYSSFHIRFLVNSFTPLVQASVEFNIPSSNLSKTKNTHFFIPVPFLYMSVTSSSFWHSLAVTIFHIETKFLNISKEVSYTLHMVSMMINRGHENFPRMFQATCWVLTFYSRDICAFCHLASFHPSTLTYS